MNRSSRAKLRYTDDSRPGITREGAAPRRFRYRAPDGQVIRAPSQLARIAALALPPAYRDVWINPDPRGHIQAVGRDGRGRKQYRYHADWVQQRDSEKFDRMLAFAKVLPRIRRLTSRHLRDSGLTRRKVLATVVQLLEHTLIRVGNEEYARTNKSYGLTTLKRQHVRVRGAEIHFEFKGKSGVRHEIEVRNPRLAAIVRKCQELPGQEIFEYLDETGKRRDVKSNDVNDYLREASGGDFSAKDYRTWAGTLLAAQALRAYRSFSSQTEAKRQVLEAIESVARRLGNTRSVCRKCYIHPQILEMHMSRPLEKVLRTKARRLLRRDLAKLSRDEAAIVALLERGGRSGARPSISRA